jgi:uncharacterized protein YbbC (DUF1343 family)
MHQTNPSKAAAGNLPESGFGVVDAILQDAVERRTVPGAVLLVGHNGAVVYRKAFGWRSLEPQRERMTVDTIFDLASLTKPIATAMSVMHLVQQGQVRLNDPVAKYLPEFARNGKDTITVRQLLTHYSGLPEDFDPKLRWQGSDAAFRIAMDEKTISSPGSRFLYSDINFIVLGFLVQHVSGMPLDRYAETHIFSPLGMETTRYLPPATWRERIAPTEYDVPHHMLRGMVHDPIARGMGGVAGNAGVFSTADDLAKFAQALLDNNGRVLDPLIVEKMTTPQQPPNETTARGLGWDIDSPFSSNRGDLLPVGSFGHTGFTGTSLWIDPLTKTYIVLLSNAVHPRGGQSIVPLRSKVATAVAAALNLRISDDDKLRTARITGYNERTAGARLITGRNGEVKSGIDVLEARNFDLLRIDGKTRRIGLVTNHTGLDSQGRRTIDVLAHAPGIELAAIFSPEHGVAGNVDTMKIGNTTDQATGVPVYSVYGETDAKRRPSAEVLKTLDAVVYDIQDIGVRYYTYETTLGYFLEAAAKTGIEMFVLDRPNPITGAYVQGPISDPGTCPDAGCRFVNYHPLPVRHGMTIGELAKLFNAERHINAKLTVVPMQGWIRGDWFDSTGISWVNPSPNMRSLTEATLYGGVGLIEGTNVSVGRGTDTPFEIVGAPWMNARELASYLNQRAISGVRFVPISFTPTADRYARERCNGVNIVLVNRNTLDAPELGIELAVALRKLYPAQYKLDRMIELLADRALFNAVVNGDDPRLLEQQWRGPLERFLQIRKQYLVY